jgi:hypothetical protein
MKPLFVSFSDFERVLSAWAAARPVYAPVSREGHRHWARVSAESIPAPELDGIRTVEPLKTFYFRVLGDRGTYPGDTSFLDDEPGFVLVGARTATSGRSNAWTRPSRFGTSRSVLGMRREKALVVGADCF